MTNYFDQKAEAWDKDPEKVERANVFAKEIKHFIPKNKTNSALEYGCGTGLLSFQLKDFFTTITLADTSEGMIQVLKEKIAKAGIQHFKPLYMDASRDSLKSQKFDVLYMAMTLHHMVDTDSSLKEFNRLLHSGGYLCIADLVKEDGSFHSNHPGFDGHNGFDREELTNLLHHKGFIVEYYKICFEIVKIVNNQLKKYPLFLLIAKKKN